MRSSRREDNRHTNQERCGKPRATTFRNVKLIIFNTFYVFVAYDLIVSKQQFNSGLLIKITKSLPNNNSSRIKVFCVGK